jgi:hypothetical protein
MKKILMAAMAVLLVGGCSAGYSLGDRTDHPGLTMKATPFGKELKFNSNGDAGITSLTYNPKTEEINVTGFRLNQDSATASQYDAEIIEKTGVAQEWQVKWVKESWTGFTAWTHEIVPVLQLLASGKFVNTSSGFNIEVPGYGTLGKTKTTDASQVQAIIQSLATQAAKIEKSTTTQPAQ